MVRHDPLGRRLESWFGLFPQLFLIWKQNPPLFLPCKKNPQCFQVFNSECSQLQTWERSDLSSWEHNMIGCSELQSWERSQVLTWEHSLNQSDCVPKYWGRISIQSIILRSGGGCSRCARVLKFFVVSHMTHCNGKIQWANSDLTILFFWPPLLHLAST